MRTLIRAVEDYAPKDEREREDRRAILRAIALLGEDVANRPFPAHLTASAWIVNKDRSLVVMAFHNLYRSWSWIGGHADGSFDLLDVARRETKEETGLVGARVVSGDILSMEVLTVEAHEKRGMRVPSHLHLNLTYLLEADESEPLRVKADENSAVRWLSPGEALSMCSEANMKPIYRRLIERVAAL